MWQAERGTCQTHPSYLHFYHFYNSFKSAIPLFILALSSSSCLLQQDTPCLILAVSLSSCRLQQDILRCLSSIQSIHPYHPAPTALHGPLFHPILLHCALFPSCPPIISLTRLPVNRHITLPVVRPASPYAYPLHMSHRARTAAWTTDTHQPRHQIVNSYIARPAQPDDATSPPWSRTKSVIRLSISPPVIAFVSLHSACARPMLSRYYKPQIKNTRSR